MSDHTITPEQLETSLKIVREKFDYYNSDLYEKLAEAKKTGSFGASAGSHYFDYRDFSEVLQKGFNSKDLHRLFEVLIYIHYFTGLSSFTIDISKYVDFDKFDRVSCHKDIENDVSLLTAINILTVYAEESLLSLQIKEPERVLKDEESLLDNLRAIKYAKAKKLHHFGDKEFIVSKIKIAEVDQIFDTTIALNPNIFYTNSPEQIIQFTNYVEPGIYIVANVPYGKKVDTAFYLVFRQKNYAYLVENNKHSYRDQYYRTRSDGTAGEDAWLYRKYEYTYFPAQLVLDFFEKQSKSKDIVPKETLEFITLGKVTDCESEIILWTYGFIDTCVQYFLKEDFSRQITCAVSPEFIVPSLITETSKSLPAIYNSSLPDFSKFDLSWDSEKVEVTDHITGTYLEKLRPSVSLESITMPTGKITSVEQFQREIMFNRRKKEADEIQESLNRDFLKNYDKVTDKLTKFILKDGRESVIYKALKNDVYPYKVFSSGFNDEDSIKDAFDRDRSKTVEAKILFCRDKKIYPYKWLYTGINCRLGDVYFTSKNCITIGNPYEYNDKGLCDLCNKHENKFTYVILYEDYTQFEKFFEITDKDNIPHQLKDYLNQISSRYTGNSLLDDIDPIALIRNPWWRASIHNEEICSPGSWHDHAKLLIKFSLCGICRNKHDKNI